MKLNKKGFTLVELLAVIVVLALLMVVAAGSVGNSLKNSKQNALNIFGQKVANAAKEECLTAYFVDTTKTTCTYSGQDTKLLANWGDYKIGTNISVTISNGTTASITAGTVVSSVDTTLTAFAATGK